MEILINSQRVDYAGQQIDLDYNTPVFSENTQEVAVEMKFPLTSKNKRIFDYPHQTALSAIPLKGREYNVIVRVGSLNYFGIGIIKEVHIEIVMTVGLSGSDFFFKIKDKKMQDIEYPEVGGLISEEESLGKMTNINKEFSWKRKNDPTEWDRIIPTITFDIGKSGDPSYEGRGMRVISDGKIQLKLSTLVYITYEIQIEYIYGHDVQLCVYNSTLDKKIISYTLTKGINNVSLTFEGLYKKDTFINFSVQGSVEKTSSLMGLHTFELWVIARTSPMVTMRIPTNINWNMDPQPYPEAQYILAPVYNPTLCDGVVSATEKSNYQAFRMQNYYDPITKRYPVSFVVGDRSCNNYFTPFPYVCYILDKIAATAGYTIRNNAMANHPELSKLVIYTNYIFSTYNEKVGRLGISSMIDLAKIFPEDMTVSDFLESLKMFGLLIYVNSADKTIDIVFLKDIFSSELKEINIFPKDLTIQYGGYDSYEFSLEGSENTTEKEIVKTSKYNYLGEVKDMTMLKKGDQGIMYYVISDRSYYAYVYDSSSNQVMWKRVGQMMDKKRSYTKNREDKVKKKYKIDVKAGLINLPGSKIDWENTGIAKSVYSSTPTIPIFSKGGKFQGLPESWDTDTELTLSLYRGKLPCDMHPEGIPTLSCDIYQMVGSEWCAIEDASIALRLEGRGGLIDVFWERFLNYIIDEAREVEIKVPYMSYSDFEIMKSDKPCRIRINGQNYITNRISYGLSDSGVIDVTFNGYTCN